MTPQPTLKTRRLVLRPFTVADADLHFHRIHAAHFTRNPASGRVMQKAGMQFEGIHRGLYQKNGVFEDAARYAIVRDDRA